MQIVINIDEDVYKRALVYKDIQLASNSANDLSELTTAVANGTPLPKCNQCKYYEGVHNVQGHAPCEYHKIGGVLWNWYCSQFEADKDVLEAKHG